MGYPCGANMVRIDKVRMRSLISDIEAIAKLTLQDKKNTQGTINCTLLSGIGQAIYDQPISLLEITEALRYYQLL